MSGPFKTGAANMLFQAATHNAKNPIFKSLGQTYGSNSQKGATKSMAYDKIPYSAKERLMDALFNRNILNKRVAEKQVGQAKSTQPYGAPQQFTPAPQGSVPSFTPGLDQLRQGNNPLNQSPPKPQSPPSGYNPSGPPPLGTPQGPGGIPQPGGPMAASRPPMPGIMSPQPSMGYSGPPMTRESIKGVAKGFTDGITGRVPAPASPSQTMGIGGPDDIESMARMKGKGVQDLTREDILSFLKGRM